MPIWPEDLDRIFEAYWRPSGVETPLDTASNGLGLGLNICSQIVKAHDGTLSLTSSADEGIIFTITIPKACNLPEPS